MYISKDELMAIPAPERTKTWNPIPHGEVFNQVDSLFQEMGVEVLNSRIDVDKSGANAFVTHRLSVGASEERCLELGWRNSVAKKFSLGFTSGSHVIVCSNLVFSGSWVEFKRHTGSLEIETVREMALSGIQTTIERGTKLAAWHDQMRELPRSRRDADHLFMEMVRDLVVPTNKILELANAYDEEVKRYGESLYTVYNCATQTFRSSGLNTISERSMRLNSLIRRDMTVRPVYDEPQVIEMEELAEID